MTQKIILWSSRKLYTFKGFIVNTLLSMFISIAFTLDMRYDVMPLWRIDRLVLKTILNGRRMLLPWHSFVYF